ncbi:hypothetical protein [Pseudonocardia sp. T1-2H]|uniref:hypothetical protein n=1 Tax=Pseudonocardia sp. T1-2H TaxID=3128899 RepID=UPI003100BC02
MSSTLVTTRATGTAFYAADGRLVATALYSSAGQCWYATDERTATNLAWGVDRTRAEAAAARAAEE